MGEPMQRAHASHQGELPPHALADPALLVS